MSTLEGLSERDKAVLRSIFDPNVTIGDVVDDSDIFIEQDEEGNDESWRLSRELCSKGVSLAEAGKRSEALQLLEQAVAVAPERAAAYNDRAQLLRLLQRDEDAMADLEKVLQLTKDKKSRARAQALCQRGLLLRKAGSKDDEARTDFGEAAKLGSAFAKKQMVELNPYAALCNQMLIQVMKGETDIKL